MRLLIGKVQDTPAGRSIFQLSPLEHGMKENVCSSLLPTPDTMPNAPNSTANRKYPKNLLQAATDNFHPMFPTARKHEVGEYQYSRGDHDKKTLTLTGTVRLYPTPCALNGHNTGTFQEWGGAGNKLRGSPEASLNVNPDWEEWFMGFPAAWTKLSDKNVVTFLEMQLSRSKSTQSQRRLQRLLKEAKERLHD
jgi:hypothetical protein